MGDCWYGIRRGNVFTRAGADKGLCRKPRNKPATERGSAATSHKNKMYSSVVNGIAELECFHQLMLFSNMYQSMYAKGKKKTHFIPFFHDYKWKNLSITPTTNPTQIVESIKQIINAVRKWPVWVIRHQRKIIATMRMAITLSNWQPPPIMAVKRRR